MPSSFLKMEFATAAAVSLRFTAQILRNGIAFIPALLSDNTGTRLWRTVVHRSMLLVHAVLREFNFCPAQRGHRCMLPDMRFSRVVLVLKMFYGRNIQTA